MMMMMMMMVVIVMMMPLFAKLLTTGICVWTLYKAGQPVATTGSDPLIQYLYSKVPNTNFKKFQETEQWRMKRMTKTPI